MSDARHDLPGRVLVEIGVGADIRPATALAARLSRIFGSRVKGVFVEDADLLQLADLALALEINVIGRQLQSLDAKALPAEIRRSLAAARREFAELARNLQCEVELEVARRRLAQPALQVERDDIFLFSSTLGWTSASPDWTAAAQAMGIAFPAARTPPQSGSIMAVLGSDLSLQRARRLLEHIAAAEKAELEVSVSDEPLSALLDLLGRADRLGARPTVSPRLIVGEAELLAHPRARTLRSSIGKASCPILLLNPGPPEIEGQTSA